MLPSSGFLNQVPVPAVLLVAVVRGAFDLLASFGVPLKSLGKVLLHALAHVKHVPQITRATRMTLLCSSGVPLECLGKVLLHTLAFVVHCSQVVLGGRSQVPALQLWCTT